MLLLLIYHNSFAAAIYQVDLQTLITLWIYLTLSISVDKRESSLSKVKFTKTDLRFKVKINMITLVIISSENETLEQ